MHLCAAVLARMMFADLVSISHRNSIKYIDNKKGISSKHWDDKKEQNASQDCFFFFYLVLSKHCSMYRVAVCTRAIQSTANRLFSFNCIFAPCFGIECIPFKCKHTHVCALITTIILRYKQSGNGCIAAITWFCISNHVSCGMNKRVAFRIAYMSFRIEQVSQYTATV